MDKFEIVMMGNTAVGKTSMLSVLSRELKAFNQAGKLQFKPTSSEFDVLDDKWNKLLKELEDSDEFLPVPPSYNGTADFVEHPFELKTDGKKKCDVVFVDSPGGFTRKRHAELIERVNNALGVFCVVDASVMMSCATSRNNELNRPAAIEEILNTVLTDGDEKQPRFVTFVLTKCERWMRDGKDRMRLSKKFHACFDKTIAMLKSAAKPPAVDMVAIQTMGVVEFAELNDNDDPVFVVVDKSMAPVDCAFPLVIMLRNVLKELIDGAGIWKRLFVALGLTDDLREYLKGLEDKMEKPVLHEEL